MGPGVATPPLPPGLRAQQGAMAGPPQSQPQDSPIALISEIGDRMRRLSGILAKTNPQSLQTLKACLPYMSQLLSELQQGPQGQQQPPTPAPTPAEVPPMPSDSAAPGAGASAPGL